MPTQTRDEKKEEEEKEEKPSTRLCLGVKKKKKADRGPYETKYGSCDRKMSLREYCEQTSLHGWFYMTGVNRGRFWRLAWTMVVLASVGVASLFIYKASEEFTKATVVTTIHSTTEPLSDVYFPAVTVCNINQVGGVGNLCFCT